MKSLDVRQSASHKLRRSEQTVAIINETIGVPLRLFPVLAPFCSPAPPA